MVDPWITLIIAGVLEPCWVYTLDKSDGFKRPAMSILTVAILVVDLYLLSITMEGIGAGTAYAAWAGIGSICTLLLGAIVYRDPMGARTIASLALVITGVVGLHMLTGDVA